MRALAYLAGAYLCSASATCEIALQRNTIQAVCALNGVAVWCDLQLQNQMLNLISALG